MYRILFSSLLICGMVYGAEPSPVNPTAIQKSAEKNQVKTMKESAAWVAMQTQLDQYDTHYTAATNSIEQVTDAKTKTALTKTIKTTDDCHDALVKLIKCFQDYVKAQGN